MKPHIIPERYEDQRKASEYLRAQFEQRELERARIAEYCGEIHPLMKGAIWLVAATIIPVIAAIIYLLTK